MTGTEHSTAHEVLQESQALKTLLSRFATRRAWLASASGPAIEKRLACHLRRIRRAPAAPNLALARDGLHLVHWNILHGTHYERVARALRGEPALAGADLVSLNEADFGLARSGNRDVAFDLASELGLHATWTALFLELEAGWRTPREIAAREQRESLFGLALLSRHALGEVRRVELPTPEDLLFDRERHVGRFVALVAEVLHPQGAFTMAVVHLDVHGTPETRAAQMQAVLAAIPEGPAVLAGDLNTTTFRRGSAWRAAKTFGMLACAPRSKLQARLLRPFLPAGAAREPLFGELRDHGFAIEPFNDATPSLDLHFDGVHEIEFLPGPLRRAALHVLRGVERRSSLRLDWIAARGFVPETERPPFALPHLMRGSEPASDHAPIGCGLRFG